MLERDINDRTLWRGKHEYRYNGKEAFVRTTEFLIKDQIGDPGIKNQNNKNY